MRGYITCVLFLIIRMAIQSEGQTIGCAIPGLPAGVQVSEDEEVGNIVYSIDRSFEESYNVIFDPVIGADFFSYEFEGDFILKTKAALDYETNNNFLIIFELPDVDTDFRKRRAVGLDTDCYISINITDVPEAPVFLDNVYDIEVEEGVTGTNLTEAPISAFDPDADDVISFSIKTPNSPFSIDSQTAMLSFASDYSIDRNVDAQVAFLTLEATDSTGLSDEAYMIVTITNINDNAPQFSLTDVTVYLSLQTPINADIQNMVATDADGDFVEYNLREESDDGYFLVDEGKLQLTRELDTNETMILHIVASDDERESTATVTVSILTCDPNAPQSGQTSNVASNDNSCSTSDASLNWIIPLALAGFTAALMIIILLVRKIKKSQEEDGDKVIPIAEGVIPVEA